MTGKPINTNFYDQFLLQKSLKKKKNWLKNISQKEHRWAHGRTEREIWTLKKWWIIQKVFTKQRKWYD